VKRLTLVASIFVAAAAMPLAAQAQGIPGGFAHGANEGYRIAGPVGAIVGAPVGGVIGGINGLLGIGPYYVEPAPRVVHRVSHRRVVRRHAKQSRRHVRRVRAQ
jgi:hypothetical protein